MKLGKRDLMWLRSALHHAIDYERSFIDSHNVGWAKRYKNGMPQRCIPKEFMPVVRRSRTRIRNWRKLIERIDRGNCAKTKKIGKDEANASPSS